MAREEAVIVVKIKDLATPAINKLISASSKLKDSLGGMSGALGGAQSAAQALAPAIGGTAAQLAKLPPHLAIIQVAFAAASAAGDLFGAALSEIRQQTIQSVKEFARFDGAIIRAAALTSDGAANLDAMRAAAEGAGLATTFSATEAAEAMTKLAMAGMSARDQIGAVRPVLDLANIGNVSLARSADIATNVLSSYGLAVQDLSRVNDQLATTFTNSNTSLTGLGKSFEYAAPLAKSTGQEMEGLLAQLGALGDLGIQGSKAGTGIRAALASLIKPTREGAAVLEELGVQVLDSEGKMRQLTAIVRDLSDAGATSKDILAIFGKVGGTAIEALVANTDKVAKLEDKIRSSEGAAARMAATVNESLDAQLKILAGTVETLQSRIGGQLSPAIKDVTKELIAGTAAAAENKTVLALVGKSGEDIRVVYRELIVVAAELLPVTLGLAGAMLDLATHAGTAYKALKFVGRLSPVTSGFVAAADAAGNYNRAIGDTEPTTNAERLYRAASLALKDLAKGSAGASDRLELLGKAHNKAAEGVKWLLDQLKPTGETYTFTAREIREHNQALADNAKKAAKAREEAVKLAEQQRASLLATRAQLALEQASDPRERIAAEAELARVRLAAVKDISAAERRLQGQIIDVREARAMEGVRKREMDEINQIATMQARRMDREEGLRNAARDRLALAREETAIGRARLQYAQDVAAAQLATAGIKRDDLRQEAEALLIAEARVKLKAAEAAEVERQRQASASAVESMRAGLDATASSLSSLTGAADVTSRALAASLGSVGTIAQQISAVVQASAKDSTAAGKAAVGALSASGRSVAGLAGALGASAAAQAGIMATFETAAAIGAGAAFLTTGNPAFATAAAQHGISAATYGIVAGTSAGASASGGGGASAGAGVRSGGGGAGSFEAQTMRGAEILADALADKLGGAGTTIVFDMRDSMVIGDDQLFARANAGAQAQGIDLRDVRRIR